MKVSNIDIRHQHTNGIEPQNNTKQYYLLIYNRISVISYNVISYEIIIHINVNNYL